MDRRSFLRPRQLAQTAGHILGALESLQTALVEEPRQEFALLRLTRRAMATKFEVLLPFGTPDGLEAGEAVLDEIERVEDQLTVYRDTSEVARLNARASAVAVTVDRGLFELLQTAARITEETDGAFDITAGPLIKAWGFFRRQHRVPSARERVEVNARVGMRHVVLDSEAHTVRFLRSGLEINLGSIGKGYALDRAETLLREEWNICSALLHGGQSSVLALGSEPGSLRGWAVGVRHPSDPERRLAVVRLRDQALATSAATFQHFEHEGRRLGHILDPRTGWPAEGMASASVIAPTAAEADALATAFFVLGVERARAYCETHADIGVILLPAGASEPVIVNLDPAMID